MLVHVDLVFLKLTHTHTHTHTRTILYISNNDLVVDLKWYLCLPLPSQTSSEVPLGITEAIPAAELDQAAAIWTEGPNSAPKPRVLETPM